MKRYGTVIVFDKGADRKACLDALEKLGAVIDPADYMGHGGPRLQEFDDETGGPVWYIP